MTFRLTAIAVLLAGLGPLVGVIPDAEDPKRPVPMLADDGAAYLVEPDESLGTAMRSRHALHTFHAAQSEDEQGACVPEPMEDKPTDAVSCRCYEVTECKGNESHECKRHCRKDLCRCCDI
jgi:hypothetical protein